MRTHVPKENNLSQEIEYVSSTALTVRIDNDQPTYLMEQARIQAIPDRSSQDEQFHSLGERIGNELLDVFTTWSTLWAILQRLDGLKFTQGETLREQVNRGVRGKLQQAMADYEDAIVVFLSSRRDELLIQEYRESVPHLKDLVNQTSAALMVVLADPKQGRKRLMNALSLLDKLESQSPKKSAVGRRQARENDLLYERAKPFMYSLKRKWTHIADTMVADVNEKRRTGQSLDETDQVIIDEWINPQLPRKSRADRLRLIDRIRS